MNNLYTRYSDSKKHVIYIKGNSIKLNEVSFKELPNLLKVHELVTVKGSLYMLAEVLDQLNNEKNLICMKADLSNTISKPIFSIKLLEQDNYAVILNRNAGIIAIIYQDLITMHKVANFKSEPY
jgi:hypothetical protein